MYCICGVEKPVLLHGLQECFQEKHHSFLYMQPYKFILFLRVSTLNIKSLLFLLSLYALLMSDLIICDATIQLISTNTFF